MATLENDDGFPSTPVTNKSASAASHSASSANSSSAASFSQKRAALESEIEKYEETLRELRANKPPRTAKADVKAAWTEDMDSFERCRDSADKSLQSLLGKSYGNKSPSPSRAAPASSNYANKPLIQPANLPFLNLSDTNCDFEDFKTKFDAVVVAGNYSEKQALSLLLLAVPADEATTADAIACDGKVEVFWQKLLQKHRPFDHRLRRAVRFLSLQFDSKIQNVSAFNAKFLFHANQLFSNTSDNPLLAQIYINSLGQNPSLIQFAKDRLAFANVNGDIAYNLALLQQFVTDYMTNRQPVTSVASAAAVPAAAAAAAPAPVLSPHSPRFPSAPPPQNAQQSPRHLPALTYQGSQSPRSASANGSQPQTAYNASPNRNAQPQSAPYSHGNSRQHH